MENFWQECEQTLRKRFDAATYDAFIKPTTLDIEDDTLILSPPNTATERWLRANVEPMLLGFLKDCFNKSIAVSYRTQKNPAAPLSSPEENTPPPYVSPPASTLRSSNLPSSKTFDSFIPGRANEIPLLAAKKISEGDSTVNPLFVYGGTGLGKTHLIQAIGNGYLKNFPRRRVLYIGARTFLNEVVQTFRLNRHEQFKSRYQNIDLLIVDDIQYIGGDKTRTQEEFFFLFNGLYEQDKSIVISCDRAPAHIEDMPRRLTSRFSAGLPTHIIPPEFELRLDIVRQKARQRHISMPEDAAYFIATQVKSNIRELEGAINRVHARAQFVKEKVTLELCRNAIPDLLGQPNIIHPDLIKEKVANTYHVSPADLSSQKRHRNIVTPRHIAIYLCRKLTNLSLPEIGRHFGKRNHTTVLHSCRQIEKKIENDPALWEVVKRLESTING